MSHTVVSQQNATACQALIDELQAAHQIIRNALSLMTLEQKAAWADRNEADGADGEGATRYHERAAMLSSFGREV
jgi:hypothetical protein